MLNRRGILPAVLSAAALGAALTSAPAAAQVRASEEGTVSQTVDGTTISLAYSRPVARGRTGLFGELVPWGHTWTPGANWATTITVSRAIRVNGQPLPEGTYTVWMVPREEGAWSVVFHTDERRFHTQRPEAGEGEALRVEAEPEAGVHMEALTWYFPVVTRDGAVLRMHWGETIVPLRVTVEPSRSVALPEEDRRPYLGAYRMWFGSDEDAPEYEVTVFEADDRLRARIEPAVAGVDAEFDLIPASARPSRDHRFNAGWYQDGELFDVDPEVTLTFDVEGGRAAGFTLEGRGRVMARAERGDA